MRVLEACNGAFFLVFLAGTVQRLEDPSERPIGDPGMVHLPQDTQKCAICQTSVTLIKRMGNVDESSESD